MYLIRGIWTLVGLSSLVIRQGNALCSSEEAGKSYRHYGWWTLYDTTAGNITEEEKPPAECEPIHVAIVARHGSRFPGSDAPPFLSRMEELAKKLNTTENAQLCEEDMAEIRNWTSYMTPTDAANIGVTGENEMRDIARRFADTFPNVFDNAGANAEKFRFLVTDLIRTTQSAEAFAGELFKDTPSAEPTIEPSERLLGFFRLCQKFRDEVLNSDSALKELNEFDEGDEMKGVVEHFADNLGLPRDEYNVSFINSAIELACAYEELSTGNASPWCLAFSVDDLKAKEYRQDISGYLSWSYAYEINYLQSCELRYAILSTLKNASMEENPTYRGYFGFTHDTTLVALLTYMKIIEDGGVLKASEYETNADRDFKTSIITPGAGNVAFVLYKCADEMKIQIFLNERAVKMPPDNPEQLWNLDEALQYYNFDDGLCDWDDICSVETPEPTYSGEPPTTETTTTTDAAVRPTRLGHLSFAAMLAIVLLLM